MLRGASPSRQATFLVFDRCLSALAKRGTPGCPKVMWKVAKALSASGRNAMLARVTVEGVSTAEADALSMLKARCAVCQMSCRNPVR